MRVYVDSVLLLESSRFSGGAVGSVRIEVKFPQLLHTKYVFSPSAWTRNEDALL
jgi:hypothetical protein